MTQEPAHPADACLHAALRAVAAARTALGDAVAALLINLLSRLFAEHTAWATSQDDDFDPYEGRPFTGVAFRDPSLHAKPICQPQIGRAPHDIHVECGQVPGYVMAGVRNRGMRALPAPHPRAPTAAARAPPVRALPP